MGGPELAEATTDFGDDDGGDANLLATFLTALYRQADRRDPFTAKAVHDMVQEAAAELAAKDGE